MTDVDNEPVLAEHKDGSISFVDEMTNSFVDYAMSVIVSRALPDVRDGLKPVHRRILYAMDQGGYTANKPYRKSARIIGDVMGKYHPHGDAAIYDAMVRMAQPWSLRLPLVDGQGNFGSIDGDNPAAMRYTEARMSRAAHDMIQDIEKNTVDFRPNYDGSDQEPIVLPTIIPNLLVNGSSGIAVGMATNIAPHNLREIVDACLLYMTHPHSSVEDYMRIVHGPDFPTSGVIMGRRGIRDAYETGRGRIVVSGVAEIVESKGGKSQIVITEFPFSVNKLAFQENLADLVNNGVIEGISNIRDLSDREASVRVVIDLKRDVDPNMILNKLRRHTRFVESFSYNGVCLNSRGVPETMSLLRMISEFIEFRRVVVRRRTVFELEAARGLLHKQIGLYAAVSMVDRVVQEIRRSADVDQARANLAALEFPTAGDFAQLLVESDPDIEDISQVGPTFKLSDVQITSILGLNLRSLTGLERDKIADRARELSAEIKRCVTILNSSEILDGIVRNELVEIREKYGTDRKTRIENGELDDLSDDDLIQRQDVILTMTNSGYVKITPEEEFRAQARGGKGKSGMAMKDGDFVTQTISCSNKSPLLFITTRGIAHSLKAYRLPEGQANSRGRPIVNVLENMRTSEGESVASILALPEDKEELRGLSMVFVTSFGTIRRSDASDFATIQRNGKIAINIEDDNGLPMGRLVNVILCGDDDEIMVTTKKGFAVRTRVGDLRVIKSRSSVGVRAVNLSAGDEIISAARLNKNESVTDVRSAYLSGGSLSERFLMKAEDVDPSTVGTLMRDEPRPGCVIETMVQSSKDSPGDFEVQKSVTLSADLIEAMKASEEWILTVSEFGFGKRSSSYDFRTSNRGAKGIGAMNLNKKTGDLVCAMPVNDDDDLMIMTASGQSIRIRIADIRVQGRNTRGVTLFRLPEGDKIVSVARILDNKDEATEGDGEDISQ